MGHSEPGAAAAQARGLDRALDERFCVRLRLALASWMPDADPA